MTLARTGTWTRRHLLDVDDLSREDLEGVLDLGAELRARREAGELPDPLRGTPVGLAFFEASTRTRVSFELAARELGATVTDLSVAGSSVAKGESLIDTLRTMARTGVRMIVLRHAASGAPYLAARSLEQVAVLNGGDGTHAHPTQALLDALTLREALGSLDEARIVIVGDAAHSRVARSNLHALVRLGASVVLCGPPAWVMPFAGWGGVTVVHDLHQALVGADAVMALRVQLERAAGSGVPSLAEYVAALGPERGTPGPGLPTGLDPPSGPGQRGRRDQRRAVHRPTVAHRAPGRKRGAHPHGRPLPAGGGPMSAARARFGSLTDPAGSFVLRGVRVIDPGAGTDGVRDLSVIDGVIREDLAPFEVARIDAMRADRRAGILRPACAPPDARHRRR